MNMRFRRLKWSIALLLLINLIGAAGIYWLTWNPVQTAFDQSLTDAAWALVPQLREADDRIQIDLPQRAKQVLRVVHFDEIYFVVRDDGDRVVTGDSDFPLLLLNERPNEVHVYDGMMRGERVRVTAMHTAIGSHVAYIGVAETEHKREQFQARLLWSLLALGCILSAASTALIWFSLGEK
jgi:two-component system sensor histidine kinase TctE